MKDEGENLLREKGPICERWGRYFFTLLNAMSAIIDRVVIEDITQRPIALSHGDRPSPTETGEALRAVATRKVTVPDSLFADLLKLGLIGEPSEILYHFHSTIAAV